MREEQLRDEIALYEIKARWCDAHGYPADAIEHRAYVAQLRRRLCANPSPTGGGQ